MKLIHYSEIPIEKLVEHYDYSPRTSAHFGAKPYGLWVSVEYQEHDEGNYNWKQWCESQEYNLNALQFPYEVFLKPYAKILHLKTAEEIFEFTRYFAIKNRGYDLEYDTYSINWETIKLRYQGIIISPYQWGCRLALESSWYYGWDCSSGCIWDISCIEKIELMEKNRKNIV